MRDTELNAGDKAGGWTLFRPAGPVLSLSLFLSRPIRAGWCSKDTNQLEKPDTESQGLRAGVPGARAEKVTRAL